MKVLFSIDNVESLYVRNKFERYLDNRRAMDVLNCPPRSCIGRWQDPDHGDVYLEPSWMLDYADYRKFVANGPLGVVDGQTCVLIVPGGGDKAYLADPFTLQPIKFVEGGIAEADSIDEAAVGVFARYGAHMPEGDWTYMLDTHEFWTTFDRALT